VWSQIILFGSLLQISCIYVSQNGHMYLYYMAL
jgi:hypothetical protein